MTHEMIRHGLNAYTLSARESKDDHLYVADNTIHKALRLVNLSISDTVYKMWLDYVKPNLDWNKKERRFFEAHINHKDDEVKKAKLANIFILPHEFLFLMCNSTDRIETIQRVHKP